MAEEALTNSSVPTTSGGDSSATSQGTDSSSLRSSPHAVPQMFSVGATSQNQEQDTHGQGLYAVQVSPFMGMMPELSPNILIPLTYKIPTRTNSTGAVGEEQGQGQGQEVARQQHGPQRQVAMRRFQFAFQLDLALLIKLAFAVILFGQEGSRQRFVVLVFFAFVIYLYQTGVMTPFIRYLQRGLIPPRPPRRQPNPPAPQNDGNEHQPGNAGDENQNQPAPEAAAENNNNNNNNNINQQQPEAEPEQANGINLWRIVREIQTFVVGFITSLLPGFDHND